MGLYIGIDSSLSCTAVAIIERGGNGKQKLISFSKIPSDPKMAYTERCILIRDKVIEIINPYTPNTVPVVIGIETPNSFQNGDVTRKLCGLYGIILVAIKEAFEMDAREINTTHAKKITTGSGDADKAKTIKSVNKIFGLQLVYSKNKKKSDDDVADALSIANCMFVEDNTKKKSIKKKRRK